MSYNDIIASTHNYVKCLKDEKIEFIDLFKKTSFHLALFLNKFVK